MAKKNTPVLTDETDALESFLKAHGIDSRAAKEVSASSWKWEDGEAKYFKVLGQPTKRAKRDGDRKEPPFTMPVKDLVSGDHRVLLLNTMLYNQLQSFPGDKLIGKCFVSIRATKEGVDYKVFSTREVPDPAPDSED